MKKGFSLIETVIYATIIGVILTIFSGMIVTINRIQGNQTAAAEVNQQLTFVLQVTQRLIRESSSIDNEHNVQSSLLVLRMDEPENDPTTFFLRDNTIFQKEGLKAETRLTADSVKVEMLNFRRIATPSASDIVEIEILMSYDSENPQKQYSKRILSVVTSL